jgi:phage terminase large subunit-like protein
MDFGTLKVEARRLTDEWEPDCILIEAMSSGPMLRSELLEAGIYTEPVKPKPGEDKTVRLNSVSDVFRSGRVWFIPTTENEAAVQECADYPAAAEDDVTDTIAYAIRRFRTGNLVSTANDRPSGDDAPRKTRAYY